MTGSLAEILPRDLFASDGAMSAAHARVFKAMNDLAMTSRMSGYEEALQEAAAMPVAKHDALLRSRLAAFQQAKVAHAPGLVQSQ